MATGHVTPTQTARPAPAPLALVAMRVRQTLKRGSSLPVLAETAAGLFVVKLRGAAHGTASLVAEVIVGALAEAIALQVPARALVTIDDTLVSEDRNDELAQLLNASRGLNLGFQFLERAHDITPAEIDAIDADTASRIVWLDWLVMNPDRTRRNPNLMVADGSVWLIDHGSSLGFHHNWPALNEDTAGRNQLRTTHLLLSHATVLAAIDVELTRRMTRETLRAAVQQVPDDFLQPLATAESVRRRREAYVAVLWKRLKSPRPFSAA